jgi:hypothetical protein
MQSLASHISGWFASHKQPSISLQFSILTAACSGMNMWCRMSFWSRTIQTLTLFLGYHARTSLIFVTAIRNCLLLVQWYTKHDNLLETVCIVICCSIKFTTHPHVYHHVSAQHFWYTVYLNMIYLQILIEENAAKQIQTAAISVITLPCDDRSHLSHTVLIPWCCRLFAVKVIS